MHFPILSCISARSHACAYLVFAILIIEDEEDLVRGIKLNLSDEGYEVDWAADGEDGLQKAQEGMYDLIILDIMLPKKNGLDICRELRHKKINTPIIMLTAKGEEVDKVLGLEIGADDYMTKPFSIRELLARIKAHLRREKREVKKIIVLDEGIRTNASGNPVRAFICCWANFMAFRG